MRARYLPLFLTLLTFVASEAKASTPCAALREISAENRKALRGINGAALRSLRGTPAWKRRYNRLEAVLNANQWPFTYSTTEEGLYTFKAADFDGDGRIDKLHSECGASSWRRICYLYLDRGGAKPLELEDGWMYLTQMTGRFYVVMDWYGPEGGGSGFPEKDFSHYYRITSRGFVAICET